jgi:hypothetical protein
MPSRQVTASLRKAVKEIRLLDLNMAGSEAMGYLVYCGKEKEIRYSNNKICPLCGRKPSHADASKPLPTQSRGRCLFIEPVGECSSFFGRLFVYIDRVIEQPRVVVDVIEPGGTPSERLGIMLQEKDAKKLTPILERAIEQLTNKSVVDQK